MSKICNKFLSLIMLVLASFSVNGLTVHIIPSALSGCAPLQVNFHSISSGASGYLWHIETAISTLDSASHIFSSPGTYAVTLTVDSASIIKTDTVIITVNPTPLVNFYASDTAICPTVPISFADISMAGTPGALRRRWDFGDGHTDTGLAPSHNYRYPGHYNIILVDTNGAGCFTSNTFTYSIHVFDTPAVNFTLGSVLVCSTPGSLTLHNLTTSPDPVTYLWKFGDGTTSPSSSPTFTHTYTDTGRFKVTLIATTINGCVDSNSFPHLVAVARVGFKFDSVVCLETPATFIDTSSRHTFVEWNFGDGSPTSGVDTIATHNYNHKGINTVFIKVHFFDFFDPYGGTMCYVAHDVNVSPTHDSFTVTPTHPCPEEDTLHFNGIVHPGDTARWVFGDHTTGYGDTTTHIFGLGALDSAFRIYNCLPVNTYILNRTTLYVRDRFGCRDTSTRVDTTYNMLFNIQPSSYQGCSSLTDTFHITTQTTVPYLFPPGAYPYPVTSYSWNFGDGSPTSAASVPIHTFVSAGVYSVICTITTANGCTFRDTVQISVGNHPIISFVVTPNTLCYGSTMTFTADTTSSPVHVDHFVWDYGDGIQDSTGPVLTRTHIMQNSGNIHVILYASSQGCSSSFTDSVTVHPPKAEIGYSYNCLHHDSVTLHNLTSGATTFLWLIPGVGSSSSADVTYIFTSSLPITFTLTTYNATWGCTDTTTLTMGRNSAVSYFTASDTTICRDGTVTFNASNDTSQHVLQYQWMQNGSMLEHDDAGYSCDGHFSYLSTTGITQTYHSIGIDTVSLIVKDSYGCYDTFSRHIFVAKPIAHFTASSTYHCVPMPVTFTDTSFYEPFAQMANIHWIFGDGVVLTSSADTAYHLYSDGYYGVYRDVYNVTAIVTDSFGCMDTVKKTSLIHLYHPSAQVWTTLISGSMPTFAGHYCIGQPVVFFGNGVVTSPYSNFVWNFGDGSSVPTGPSYSSHSFGDTGVYHAYLTVTDSIGCVATGGVNVSITKPNAVLSTPDPFIVCHPFFVGFINSSTRASSYTWDFGDGGHGYDSTASHSYSDLASGLYTISLTATDRYGCSDTDYTHVTFFNDSAGFVYPNEGCKFMSVQFSPLIGSIDSIKWEFGDLQTFVGLTLDTIYHIYPSSGTYIPKLIVYKNGCRVESIGIDTIKVDSLHADFSFSPNPVCPFSPVTFTDLSTSRFSSIDVWHWSFSTTDSSNSPALSVGAGGPVSVRLIASTPWHCNDTVTHSIPVYPRTLIVSPPVSICPGTSSVLTASGGSGFSWYPSTGLSCTSCASTNANPTTTTTYTVTGINSNGCNDTAVVTVTVFTSPNLTVINASSSICIGQSSILTASGASTYSWSPSGSLSSGVGNPVTAFPLTTTIYTVIGTDDNGCTDTATTSVVVYPQPVTSVLASPATSICLGGSVILTASGATSYTWSPSGSLSSAVDSIVTASPVSTTTYSVIGADIHGCKDTADVTITVYPIPSITLIGNAGSGCIGTNVQLYDSVSDGFPGYSYLWNGSDTFSSIIKNPLLTSITTSMNGWYVLTVTDAHGCMRKDSTYVTTYTPTAFNITGDSTICMGASTVLTASPSSGMTFSWLPTGSLSCPACAVTTADPAVTTIYTISAINSYGCTSSSIKTVTVNLLPTIPPITGNRNICLNSDADLTDSITGGVWTTSDTAITMIYPFPSYVHVHGNSIGTSIITYTVTDEHGCVGSDTFWITVSPLPVVSLISGDTIVCLGSGIFLYDSVAGGIWETYDSSIAYIDSSTGYVTSVHTGYTGFDYYILDGNGCYASSEFYLTVNPLPYVPPMTPKTVVCQHDSTILVDTLAGGIWSSGDTLIATVDQIAFVYGVSPGMAMITYTYTDGYGCSNFVADTITVYPLPPIGPIVGSDTICLGSTLIFTDSVSGGWWTSDNPGIATVDSFCLIGVHGVAVGTTVISYTTIAGYPVPLGYACWNYATDTITVIPIPVIPPISGGTNVCVGGTLVLSNAVAGGTWVSYNPFVADVDPLSGIVTGYGTGTAVIAYDVSSACGISEVYDTINVIADGPPILGNTSMCTGMTSNLSNIVTGGTWSSSDVGIAYVDPLTGLITGIAEGTATITYTATGPCGVFTVTTTVLINMPPYVTTSFWVTCQSLSTKSGSMVILSTTDCVKVCDSTIVRYFANGGSGAMRSWVVTGGTVINDYGDSLDVFWPSAGTIGSVTLYDTINSCKGTFRACIIVIEKPHAIFSASATSICLNGNIIFTDISIADPLSPIVSWYWDFGDGSYSPVENPEHHFDTPNDNDTVTLVVTNACGCADTFRTVIQISKFPGPEIECSSIACEDEVATYTTGYGCGIYNWSVIGGTIISSPHLQTILVRWGNGGSAGYGTVSLAEPCGDCQDTTTIKIQIIQKNAVIEGPNVICTGQQYQYTLPLWAATEYMWGVLGSPSSIIVNRDDYKVTVQFTTPGTYTLHGWYQNSIKLCGGNIFRTITVVKSTKIIGKAITCQYSVDTFKLNTPGLYATWTLTDATGTMVQTGTGVTFNAGTYPAPGVYTLTASGSFCADAFEITVSEPPSPVSAVIGIDTICLGRVYSYTAGPDVSGTTFNWQAIGGSVTPSSGSSTVAVVWTSSGAKQLVVQHISTSEPYCTSTDFIKDIYQEVINPTITGDTTPCANAYRDYTSNYTRAEVYDWSIYPTTAGSVVAGDHTPAAHIMWNDVSGTVPLAAAVIVTIHKCDSVIADTLNLMVQPSPPPTVSAAPNPGCPKSPIVFTAATGGSTYSWTFGDGTPIVTTLVNTITHEYPINNSTSSISYNIKVAILPDPTALCPVSGIAHMVEDILPGPVAFASAEPNYVCMGSPTTLVGTVTNNAGPLTYQWYTGGAPIGGAVGVYYSTGVPADYYFTVTSANGCTDTSNLLDIYERCPAGGCWYPTNAYTYVGCNTIILYGSSAGISRSWGPEVIPVTGYPIPPVVNPPPITYDKPGIYAIHYDVVFPGPCYVDTVLFATIGVVPDFRWELRCGTGGYDSVFLSDHTALLPSWHITNITWMEGSTTLGTGDNLVINRPAPGSYFILEVVTGTKADGSTFVCNIGYYVTLPSLPTISFTLATSPICSGIPINFTPAVVPGIANYFWAFGDGATSALEFSQRTYTYPGPLSNNLYQVDLTVIDSIGCIATSSDNTLIFANRLQGNLGFDQIVCPDYAPVTLTWFNIGTAPISYLWTTGATTSSITTSVSGAYWLTVKDVHSCQLTAPTPALNVKILRIPIPVIAGKRDYCFPDKVHLSGYAGKGVSYQWYRSSGSGAPSMVGTAPYIDDVVPVAGNYQYKLVLHLLDTLTGIYCDTSAIYNVHVHGVPVNPTISIPTVDCDMYHITLSASASEPGTFNWSNGATGPVIHINTGGAYRAYFTNTFGCQSHRDISVPMSPDTYFPYFPSGCYTICREQLPLTLHGPPHVAFHPWYWLFNGSPVSSGTGIMAPYVISNAGDYSWKLNSGLCAQSSDVMSVSLEDCSKCQLKSLAATVTCDPGNPASYHAHITFVSPGPSTSYTLGTDIGPIVPFSGFLASGGPYVLDLTFTLLPFTSPPSSVIVKIIYTLPNGQHCYEQVKVPLPFPCGWIAEKPLTDDSSATDTTSVELISNSMLVFPNPASGKVTVHYDFGGLVYGEQSIFVYDQMGRRVEYTLPEQRYGDWIINTNEWVPGIYIIRMQGGGKTLQTQKVVISH